MEKHTNKLIEESSPYLLQHAHNPVEWKVWGPEVFQEAKTKNKLVLISIGYSACHWCHVMAHESFEDEKIADLMNENFVNIKVDREERPDVDQVYMIALQLMTGQGGWPLNIVALPDGRPIWGGTYLRKEQWAGTLRQLRDLHKQGPKELLDYAEKLTEGIQKMEPIITNESHKEFDPEIFSSILSNLKAQFDPVWGGTKGAPKFMMPNKLHFLLRCARQTNDPEVMDHVSLTLDKMSFGGIFDQLGGGFSRYSTDERWQVPHFEKMLYDNAQLVSLYCDAFLVAKNSRYEKVVRSTLEFVERELTSELGSFYCALDADSLNAEGVSEEGAYYVWKKEELRELLGEDFDLFSACFNINETGHWENGKYVLMRTKSSAAIAEKYGISENKVEETIHSCKKKLFDLRKKRAAPKLDDKCLTSWNALMLKAYCDAYRVFNEQEYLKTAVKNAEFILEKQVQKNGDLFHAHKNGKSTVNGYLEDYAFTIEAFISLYENTFTEKWLLEAKKLTEKVFENFYDETTSIFYFTSHKDHAMITRPVEYQDNVMPSSNSVMAKNLFKLSYYFDRNDYRDISENQLKNLVAELQKFPQAYSNWGDLLLNFVQPFYEVVLSGEKAKTELQELNKSYVPNKLVAGSETKSGMVLLKNRWLNGETQLFVCIDKACRLPVRTAEAAINQMI